MPNIYTENEVKIWERLFEEIGSFYGVEIFLKENGNGSGPGYQTIRENVWYSQPNDGSRLNRFAPQHIM